MDEKTGFIILMVFFARSLLIVGGCGDDLSRGKAESIILKSLEPLSAIFSSASRGYGLVYTDGVELKEKDFMNAGCVNKNDLTEKCRKFSIKFENGNGSFPIATPNVTVT